MKEIIVKRTFQNQNKTLSDCSLWDQTQKIFSFVGIELPWLHNEPQISCIPANMYRAVATKRASNGKYALWVQDVPGRSQIMVHTANFARDLRGCLAPGTEFVDIDKDGIIDVSNSQIIMNNLATYIPLGEEIKIHFIDAFRIIGNLDPKTEKRV